MEITSNHNLIIGDIISFNIKSVRRYSFNGWSSINHTRGYINCYVHTSYYGKNGLLYPMLYSITAIGGKKSKNNSSIDTIIIVKPIFEYSIHPTLNLFNDNNLDYSIACWYINLTEFTICHYETGYSSYKINKLLSHNNSDFKYNNVFYSTDEETYMFKNKLEVKYNDTYPDLWASSNLARLSDKQFISNDVPNLDKKTFNTYYNMFRYSFSYLQLIFIVFIAIIAKFI